jgi:hypothetical protein
MAQLAISDERRREAKARRMAKAQGYALRKSRARTFSGNNLGGYMIVDPNLNAVVCGERYDLTLEDVEEFLRQD